MTGGRRRALLGGAILAGHVLLGLGLTAPCMTVIPRMEPHTGLARWLGVLDEPRTYSVLGGILDLLRRGEVGIGLVLLLFSVVFPVAKLIAVRLAFARELRGEPPRRGGLAAHLGKFSMVDVFVIALLVLVSRRFPGGTTVDPRWGAWAFAAAALLPIPVALALARRDDA